MPKKEKTLTDGDLKKVKGGAVNQGTGNKSKTADKAFDAMSDYIRS